MMKTVLPLFILALLIPFGIHAQSVSSATPNNAQQGDALTVSIVGLNTNYGNQGTATQVYLFQGTATIIQAVAVNIISPTLIDASFNIPSNASLGFYDVYAGIGVSPLSNGFQITPGGGTPTIQSITANSATQGDGLTVTVIGLGTNWGSGTSTSMWLSQGTGTTIYGTNVNVLSNTTLQATLNIPNNANVGFWDVNATNSVALFNGFEVLLDVGVEEFLNGDNIKIYPNPANSESQLYFELNNAAKVHVEVFDVQGRSMGVLLNQEQAAGPTRVALNKAGLNAAGEYFARITVNGKAAIVKFIYNK